MRTWDWNFNINTDPNTPIFLNIARQIMSAVRDGKLKPGDPLPGSRELAKNLGVHRNTILAALRELSSQGWVTSEPGRGTFIAADLIELKRREKQPLRLSERMGFELRGRTPSASAVSHTTELINSLGITSPRTNRSNKLLQLVGGLPDLRLLPLDALSRAYRRALRSQNPSPLGYSDPRGDPRLRSALASMLSARRGLTIDADSLLVTRGSQMALTIAASTLFSNGDLVAVESWGYRPAWESLTIAGAKLIALPVDSEGLRVDLLAELLEREPIRGVYLTPHHQYPTTVSLSPARRLQLLDLARRKQFAIIEDDYDHEFHYEGRPVLPLASNDTFGNVIYIGTLSKILAPGLRLGFVVAPKTALHQMMVIRTFIDRQGDQVVERAVAELLEDGELARHARRMRKVYLERRDCMISALQKFMPNTFEYTIPAGGLALWTHVLDDINVEQWRDNALSEGVVLHTARRFSYDEKVRPFFRLGFAPVDNQEIELAIRKMAKTLPRSKKHDAHSL